MLRFDKIIIIHDFNTDIDGENESLDINVIFFKLDLIYFSQNLNDRATSQYFLTLYLDAFCPINLSELT